MLADAMASELAELGEWQLRKSDLSFVQPFSEGFWRIMFQYKSWGGKFLAMSFGLGMRFDDVQNLLNLDHNQLSRREKLDSTTIGTLIINIKQGHEWEWDIEDRASSEQCAKDFAEFMRKVGLPSNLHQFVYQNSL